jgi:hypothetical protein
MDIKEEVVKEEKELNENFVASKSDIVDEEICKNNVPSKFNIYKWAKLHPSRTISNAIFRMEKIFDQADEVSFGFSGGKDSTLSAELAILELKRRRARVKANVKRDGSEGIDPLDEKWVSKKLWFNSQDCEWIWSAAISHIQNFIQHYGPGMYEFNGKKMSGNTIFKLKDGSLIELAEIYKKVENGESVDAEPLF